MSAESKKPLTNRQLLVRILLTGAGFAVLIFLFLVGSLVYFSLDLPSINSLNDYDPPRVTRVFSDDGHLVGELYRERRTVAPVDAIPEHAIHAFLSAEDAKFYEHEGLDYFGILRAAIKNLRPGARLQGASTITQQTVKTMVVGDERSYSRKMREALLTRELEQMLTKDEILNLYLNQIYFGRGAYGIEEAARIYFGKSVKDVTLDEAAYLACAPKNPNHYNLRAAPQDTKARQRYVLEQMLNNGWAEEEDVRHAIAEPIPWPETSPTYLGKTPHYVEHVRRLLLEEYEEEEVYEAGFTVYTGMNAVAQMAAQSALRLGLEEFTQKQHGWPGAALRIEVDKFDDYLAALHEIFAVGVEKRRQYGRSSRRPLQWVWDLSAVGPKSLADRRTLQLALLMVPFATDLQVTGVVTTVDVHSRDTFVDLGSLYARIPLKIIKWARAFGPRGGGKEPKLPSQVFNKGDLVRVVIEGRPRGKHQGKPVVAARLVPRPVAQGAMVAIDPHTRYVRALVGGYDMRAGELIRAVQSRRQPGSSFKPILYAAAISEKAITPASLCPDSPVVIRDPWTGKKWQPENYDGKYDGNITYRQALTKSKNTCSVKLIDKIGYEPVIDLARRFGIKSDMPENLTLALGTADMTPLELSNAYATLAAGGLYAEPIFIRKVVDKSGEILKQQTATLEPAMDPAAAYVVTQMMRSVVEEGTATRALVLDRMVVGKTGTSQQSRNVWFSGFSPEIAATVWAGFDDNKPLGRAYGGSVALPIWIRFMGRVLAGIPEREFEPPENIVNLRIDKKSGEPTESSDEETTIMETFIAGTEPEKKANRILNPFLIDEEEGEEGEGTGPGRP